MTWTWMLRAAAIGSMAVASALLGQDAPLAEEPAGETRGCVSIGRPWRGTADEIRSIETVPVPATFRREFESTATCDRYWLIHGSLIDWHLAFGSERSLTAALGYLAADYLRDVPAPAEFADELRRAWRAMERDLRNTSRLSQAAGRSGLRKGRGYRAVDTLVEAEHNYTFLAEQSLRAAEEFGSLALLARAELFLQPLVEGDDFLSARQGREPAAAATNFHFRRFRIDELRMRAAVLRAQITRESPDVRNAEITLENSYHPLFLEAAENAYEAGDNFCDFEESERRAAVTRACRHDDDPFPHRVINYWISRAMLDLVADSREPRDELALRLLQREQSSNSLERYFRHDARVDMLRIRLARAEMHRRKFLSAIPLGDRGEIAEGWRESLEDLRQAERLVTPFEEPRRFRAIASAWLDLWGRAPEVYSPADEAPNPGTLAERERYAAYLRRLLANLDAISVGE